MKLYRSGPHTVFDLKYHLVWTTKYRKPILTGRIGLRVRDLIREICRTENVQIIRGHVSKDHIHLFISMPPQISVSKIAQLIKGKTSRKILIENPKLNKQFWGRHFWSRGYFATTSGAITDEMIMQYIQNQDDDLEKRGDEFTILDLE
ncbi:MAG: IS200/IS605 family transposase [Patescibacteria group bacterium]|nr:IS200/IS605 family transposase [Patescibacteria group bacterium]